MATPGVTNLDSSRIGAVGGPNGKSGDPLEGIEAASGPAQNALGIKENAVEHGQLMGIMLGLIDIANRQVRKVIDSLSFPQIPS